MPPDKPKSPLIRLGSLILLVIILIIISSKFLLGPFDKTNALISPNLVESINLTSKFTFIFKDQKLKKIVEQNLFDKQGQYAIYIEDLTDAESYTSRSSDSFPSASLYKLYLIAAVLNEINQGRLGMEDIISADKTHLEDAFGGVDFGYEEEASDKITYTVEETLIRIGRISDNFAAIMLAEKITWDKVQEMADALGVQNTIIKTPITTSAYDIANFFRIIFCRTENLPESYQGCQSLADQPAFTKEEANDVIKYLSLDQLNNRIPAKLPEGVKIVHKTGELGRIRHDAGIVYLTGRPYIIVLMSQQLQYEDEAVETLAEISKDVYEYFKNKGK